MRGQGEIKFRFELDVNSEQFIIVGLFITEVPEIQDVHCPKSMAPPPTAQTAGPNWLKFFMEALQEDSFRGTEAIFEFRPRS